MNESTGRALAVVLSFVLTLCASTVHASGEAETEHAEEEAGFHHVGVFLGGATRPEEQSDTQLLLEKIDIGKARCPDITDRCKARIERGFRIRHTNNGRTRDGFPEALVAIAGGSPNKMNVRIR